MPSSCQRDCNHPGWLWLLEPYCRPLAEPTGPEKDIENKWHSRVALGTMGTCSLLFIMGRNWRLNCILIYFCAIYKLRGQVSSSDNDSLIWMMRLETWENEKKMRRHRTVLTENGLSSGAAVPEPGAPKGLSSNPVDDICSDFSAGIWYLCISQ